MRVLDMEIREVFIEDTEYHDMKEPQELVETFLEKESHTRKPSWAHDPLQEYERFGAPKGIHRERKSAKPYNRFVALLCDIIDK